VKDLVDEKIAVESEGATVIFVDSLSPRNDGKPDGQETQQPLIIQKSDGGYLYATTDLAAVKHRVEVENATRIIYVTDSGQSSHFDMVFKTAKFSKNLIKNIENVQLCHVPFGLVLGFFFFFKFF
jgi:arginyl-tRNA synthetase